MSTSMEHGGRPVVPSSVTPDAAMSAERDAARKRLERRNKFRGDLVGYLAINAFLVGIWAASGFGYFWPGWILGGWGLLLLLDAWNVYFRHPVTEADIDRELSRRK
ncbi:MAG: 2TM domain-containing protein [Jatrophihabitans sp.]|uniref:2TM domain-containing protein n=1 Tax=Jatrophihabitans sp. TaxID=1932789 RepID=UPI003F7EE7E9